MSPQHKAILCVKPRTVQEVKGNWARPQGFLSLFMQHGAFFFFFCPRFQSL